MTSILLAAIFFLGIHLLVSGTTLRDRLVAGIGERAYLAVFALASLAGISWLCASWAAHEPVAPWWNGRSLLHPAYGVVFIACQLVVIGLTTPSPTAAGGEKLLTSADPARGILRVTRHPFLWGVAIWSGMHLLLNPDPPAFLLFGTFAVLALVGPRSIDAKRARAHGEAWERFAAVTSNLPFAAIAQGRNSFVLAELGWWRIALGAAVFVGLLYAHPWVSGVAIL